VKKRNYPQKEATIPDIQTSIKDEIETSPPQEGTVSLTDYTVAANLQDLDDKIKSMMKVGENKNTGVTAGNTRICKVCGKEGEWSNIKRHIEANHITGVSHSCNICGHVTRTRDAMTNHNRKHI